MMTPSGWMMKPEPSPCTGCGEGFPRKKGANGLLGPNGFCGLLSPLSSSPGSWPLKLVGILLTTWMLTTAGPYFCTMLLKSGSITEALPVTDAGGGAVTAAGGAPSACAAPATYSVQIGTPIRLAPSIAAASGFLKRFGTFMGAPSFLEVLGQRAR